MSDMELIARWRSITGVTSEEMAGFFQAFRPLGVGLVDALQGVSLSGEIVPRLLEIYAATADGYRSDAYFIVRRPPPLSNDRAAQLAVDHCRRMEAISRRVQFDKLAQLLQTYQCTELIVDNCPESAEESTLEDLLDDAVTEFMFSMTPLDSQALLLSEAIYYIACDSYIRNHVLWPLYRHATAVCEPFEPYFDLWKYGAGVHFGSDKVLRVYVPRPAD